MGLLDVLAKPAEKYVKGQMRDAALFVGYAVMQGYNLHSKTAALKLARAAVKWCLKHGTPTPEKVKKTLSL